MLRVQELGGAQVRIAQRVAGIEGGGIDIGRDAGSLRLLQVEGDRGVELLEVPAHRGHDELAHGELDAHVRPVQHPCHVVPFRRLASVRRMAAAGHRQRSGLVCTGSRVGDRSMGRLRGALALLASDNDGPPAYRVKGLRPLDPRPEAEQQCACTPCACTSLQSHVAIHSLLERGERLRVGERAAVEGEVSRWVAADHRLPQRFEQQARVSPRHACEGLGGVLGDARAEAGEREVEPALPARAAERAHHCAHGHALGAGEIEGAAVEVVVEGCDAERLGDIGERCGLDLRAASCEEWDHERAVDEAAQQLEERTACAHDDRCAHNHVA